MEKVQILMSTYNGEKYLEEQIISILNQDYTQISLLIRDDGSKDKTIDIIKKYTALDNRITYYQGENLGVINSFFDLIKNADPAAEYYSLSDQDDVWKPDKISRAVEKLGNEGQIPVLYCTETELVNEDLNHLKNIHKSGIRPGFGNALVESVSSGCTYVLNHKLLELVKTHIPDFTIMHDWWIYLSASAFGKVLYDDEATILYRQHSGNVMGNRTNYIDEFRSRVRYYKKNNGQLRKQAIEFKRLYSLDKDKEKLLNMVINTKSSFFCRIAICSNNQIYRQRRMDHYIFKLLFLFGNL